MTQQLNAAMAAGNVAEAATLAFALAGLGELPIAELFGIAGMLGAQGRGEQADALYRLWLRNTDSPLLYAGWYNLAVLQVQAGDERGAEQSYRAALALREDFSEAGLGLGSLLERARQYDAALEQWRQTLERVDPAAPNHAALQVQLLNNIGRLSENRNRHHEAEEAFTRSLRLNPQQAPVITHWVHLRQKQCAWPVLAPLPGLGEAELLGATSALATLSASDDPAVQLAAARRYVKEKVLSGVAPLSDPRGYRHRRLRVGYLSSDFCSHAVAILTAELYQLHDRARVEVFGFCWSNEDGSGLRARVVRGMDHHVRIVDMSDEQAARCIRSHEIDILVDLHGLTLGARHDILSWRPAPVQIAWLGFPGTSGMDSIDYVLADPFVLPPALAPHFTEQPLYLPDTFQVNDRQRLVGPRPGRADCALPAEGFVFCSFNNNHKLTPEQFASWMRILQRVPASVLWLVADSEQVRDNLRMAALRHGVPSERLVFAERALPSDYLARYQTADLFLDTLPFNAGTTASDALWAGLPLLTRAGRSFAGRMAGSLLHAVGLPELVTDSVQDYEDTAVRLAGAPAELAALRQRLAANRDASALFDSPRFVRNLEQLYLRVARGSLLAADAGADAADDAAGAAARALPLVSILLPVSGADGLLATLAGALAQSYTQCEIVVSDSSADGICRALLAPYLHGGGDGDGDNRATPRLRYSHAAGLSPADNLNHCLALALGQYLACTEAGELLHADKIARMMHCYLNYPGIGLVVGWRQPQDGNGADLPEQPMFGIDTAVGGASLTALLLGGEAGAALCEPGAMLLRRADIGAALGRYQGRQYQQLGGLATLLTALAGRDCVYLSQPLGSYLAPAQPDAVAGHAASARTLARALESLNLLYQVHAQNLLPGGPARFKTLLAARLAALAALVTGEHARLGAEQPQIDELCRLMQQGYRLLLSD
ncbi:UDP-N-acetylglucosamine-peptide N-acetylglucosaminyltransferase [Rugamonas sp. CCM 8940]|uniref:O-linked N-acetylglucosamine transferase family protein n=1 Tax=Rugamonas sp. CCM 8940 TaxID=2765359 RepID=UPI0018F5E9A5|nr:UDP-N-acetylglucosamine-peptide N-acetylglucosaminyltransferase [Rugamonas sp. CCM 8940]MBJ7309758.1 UDP-N-acetylglucosamine-peptide N-acetylglucosaminyltransferase [Rugamonas sp. CCM 8940]